MQPERPERPEPRRNRIATETSASDGWVARLSNQLPNTPESRETRPEAARVTRKETGPAPR
jgi:hypothetical protein